MQLLANARRKRERINEIQDECEGCLIFGLELDGLGPLHKGIRPSLQPRCLPVSGEQVCLAVFYRIARELLPVISSKLWGVVF